MPTDRSRPDPEQLLRLIELEQRRLTRGKLKLFLGYKSGVGKSFQMLDEARRRHERGEDVVVAAVQAKYEPDVQQLLSAAETIAPLRIDGFEVLDVNAILQRHPQVVVIDGLAFNNPSGSRHAARWQDVEEVLENGISVITSVNLQYIDELKKEIERITGRYTTHGIPRSFLNSADEIVVVDAPAVSGLLPGRDSEAQKEDEQSKLLLLREMALLVAAEVVDQQLEAYIHAHQIDQTWGTHERILVCVTPKSDAEKMIESGRRNADRFHGELLVAHVRQPMLSHEDQAQLERNLGCARRSGAAVVVLEGLDPLDAILGFARKEGITQIFIGQSLREGGWRRLWGSFVNRLIRSAEGIDVTIFPH